LEKKRLLKVAFFEPVQELIQQVEERMLEQAEGSHPQLELALDHLLSSGGKRLRVVLTLLTGEMLGGNRDALVTLAASLELLHTATLVHDDLIDGSLIRRGIPTLNAQWSAPATVLTGDFLFAKAAKLAADVNLVPVMQLFAETLATIVNGEIIQLFGRQGKVDREDYERRIYAKTASLFEAATKSAGIVSQLSTEKIELIRQFGYEVGMAFQIVDDILDFTSEQEAIGKPVANDLRQGIITLPVIYYLDNEPDDETVENIIQGKRVSSLEFDRLIQSIRDSGSIEKTINEANEYVARSLEILSEFPESQPRSGLIDLARFTVQRTK
jgi:geranylgeranyl pyrophosphate synthase